MKFDSKYQEILKNQTAFVKEVLKKSGKTDEEIEIILEKGWGKAALAGLVGMGALTGGFMKSKDEYMSKHPQIQSQIKDADIKPVNKEDKKEEVSVPTKRENHGFSQDFLNFVKKYEADNGFFKFAYMDGKKDDGSQRWSIGYGTLARPEEEGGKVKITEQEAFNRLIEELKTHRNRVLSAAKKTNVHLNSNELDALTSFDYNTGAGRKAILNSRGKKSNISNYMKLFKNFEGKENIGLMNRRADEVGMFANNDYNVNKKLTSNKKHVNNG